MSVYLTRTIEPLLIKAASEFPAVTLTGPRQSGKTTILKRLFSITHRYVSLELPEFRLAIQSDPKGFLSLYPPPVIYDEAQYAPLIMPYIKEIIDANRDLKGQFIISGSQNINLQSQASESLAGRTAVLTLPSLTFREISGHPQSQPLWCKLDMNISYSKSYSDYWEMILKGSYPEIVINPERDVSLWRSSYIQTYLERDVRLLRNIGDLSQFQVFMRALAIRSGQILNLTDCARDCGISVNTAKIWISVLEASQLIMLLRPYYNNLGKRLVKSPKVYFLDSGLLTYLLGLTDVNAIATSAFSGPIFETAVVSDIYKTFLNRGEIPRMYFWRTTYGDEVDVVIEENQKLIPIEIKASASPKPNMAQGIIKFMNIYKENCNEGYVVHLGDNLIPLAVKVKGVPLEAL